MRTRRNHRSAKGRASSGLAKSLGTITVVASACASILVGACGDPQPVNSAPTSSGTGGMGSSSSGGDGGDGLSDFTTSSNVSTSSSTSASSSGGPKCPVGNPNGGATKVASAFGDAAVQTGSAVAYDKSGNILLAGSFSGSINLGGTTLTSAGSDDVFVAKFSPAGQLLWAKQFGDGQVQNASGVGADANGNVYVTGSFKGAVNFGGGALSANGTLFSDIYLAKLGGADGSHMWSKRFGDEYVQNARGLAVDAAGNVIVVGSFQLTVNFGGGTLTAPGGTYDGFIAKFDTAGMHQWSRQYGDASDQHMRSVAIDPTGNVYVAGDAAGAIDFGGGPLTATQSSSAFVAKLDSLGNATWVKMSKGMMSASAVANAVAVGPDGDVVVGGGFKGTFEMGGDPVDNLGTDDAFVVLYTAAGVHKYTKTFGDAEKQTTTGVAIAPNGQVFVAADFSGTIDLGAGDVMSAGGFDGVLARLDSIGCPVWARAYGGPLAHTTKALALDPTTGGVALTGSFSGSADFGTGMITAAGEDVFLVAVNP